jgi:tetratricopeptide (TPR) repeat protein
VTLTVEDDEGATNIVSQKMTINNPPQANFTITPQNPVVGDLVKFDASKSDDAENGNNLAYHWEINNNSAIFSVVSPPKQVFDEKGMYWINLTVTDKNGARGYKNLLLKINQPPIPRIAFDSTNLSLGKMINFSASTSEDPDGEIVSYLWDFGDNSAADYNKTVLHSYRDGGTKTVWLSVKDDDGAKSNISKEIFINRLPTARFSIDPRQPKKGELVSFDASASSDPDGKIQRYLWDFGVGKAESEVYYSEFAEHTYNRPKKYNITLTVEDDKGATGSFSQSFEVEDINNMPTIISLQPDKTSPQDTGSVINWTTEASDLESDPISYRFLLNNTPATDWQSQNQWAWKAAQPGISQIEVQVKDNKHTGSEGIYGKETFEFIITTHFKEDLHMIESKQIDEGDALSDQGRYEEALQAYEEAIKNNPNDAGAWNNKGVALNNLIRYDEALLAYENAIKIDPQYAEAWNNKGIVLCMQGKYNEAMPFIEKSLELNPRLAEAWYAKGLALHYVGRSDEAEAAFAKAKELGYIDKT